MTEIATSARPYARAAFQSAQAASRLAAWSEFLQRASSVVSDSEVIPLLDNPRVSHASLLEFIAGIALDQNLLDKGADAQMLQGQRNLLQLLVEGARLPLLPEITAQFDALRADAEHIADVEVLSARDLTDEQAAKLKGALEKRFGRAVRLHPRVDASLLGGAVVRYGDFVIDGSLRGRIERLGVAMSAA